MFHLAVFTGSQAQSTAFTQVPLLQTLFENIQANGLQPSNMPLVAAIFTQGAHLTRLQMVSPSLRQAGLLADLVPIRKGVLAANIFPNEIDLRQTPLKFVPNESVQPFITQNNAGAEQEYVALLICDQVPAPVKKPFKTVRFTGSTTLVANALTQCILTSEQQLPAGKYDVIGFRPQSATGVFARIGTGFSGSRPGGPCATADDARIPEMMRGGELGTWFTFANTDQVVAEFMATAADTAQIVEFDLVGPY